MKKIRVLVADDSALMRQTLKRFIVDSSDFDLVGMARDGEDAFTRAGLKLRFRPPGGESTEELHDRVAAFMKDVARENSDAIAVAHMGVLRAAYTLATGWDMSAPMPPDLDISKALILSLASDGVPTIHALNVDLPARA